MRRAAGGRVQSVDAPEEVEVASAGVIWSCRPGVSVTTPTRARTPAGSVRTSQPATVASPDVGASSPASRRTVVVLPAPFGPSSARIVPAGTVSDTSSTATTLPNWRRSPRASITSRRGASDAGPARRAGARTALATEAGTSGTASSALELEQEEREVRRTRQPHAEEAPGRGDRRGGLQQLLRPQRGPDLDPGVGGVRPGVAEPVRRARRHQHGVARSRQDRLASEDEAQPTGEHGEQLRLYRMGVARGYVRRRRQEEIEDEQAAAGLGAAGPDDDALAADRIDDHALGAPLVAPALLASTSLHVPRHHSRYTTRVRTRNVAVGSPGCGSEVADR